MLTNQRCCCQTDFHAQSQLDGCHSSGEGGVDMFMQVSRDKLKG